MDSNIAKGEPCMKSILVIEDNEVILFNIKLLLEMNEYNPVLAKNGVEAIDIMKKDDKNAGLLHISEIWPFPTEQVKNQMEKSKQTYTVENNATGQLARLIQRETGKQVNGTILKYDGRPFSPGLVVSGVEKEGC